MGKPIKFVVVNEDDVVKELAGKGPEVATAVGKVIQRGALKVANRMIKLIGRGGRSGREYSRPGGTTHQASAEGEPPKSDTGFLAAHIKPTATKVKGNIISAEVIVSAAYSGWLEDGTEFMGPRPFAQPSFDLEVPGIRRDMAKAVKKGVK
jgi:hypothetical protein